MAWSCLQEEHQGWCSDSSSFFFGVPGSSSQLYLLRAFSGGKKKAWPISRFGEFRAPDRVCGSEQLWSWRGGPSLCWFLWSLSGSQNLQSGLSFPQRKKSGQQLFLQSLVSEFFLWGMLKTERKPQKTKLRLKTSASFQDLLLKIFVLHIWRYVKKTYRNHQTSFIFRSSYEVIFSGCIFFGPVCCAGRYWDLQRDMLRRQRRLMVVVITKRSSSSIE